MPLAKLRKLAGRLDRIENPPLPRERALVKREDTSEQIVVQFPNASEGEQIVWDYISKRDDRWIQQSTFGNIKERGSTRVDFLHPIFRIALYPQGAFVHRFKSAWDAVKYSLVRKHGYRVVEWIYYSNEHLKRNLERWYLRDIG
jgi:hypothetical protein